MRFTRRIAHCFVNRLQVLFPCKGQNAVQSHTAITSIALTRIYNFIVIARANRRFATN
ncbi:hypothetical protein [Helicobacter macacae]|uniref:hypothetical protein n=1 Tax=Helicobacter macacae TaxID=398626 RepID=UPI0016522A63|nr:hypothetical protein [Helicobacter macacae]